MPKGAKKVQKSFGFKELEVQKNIFNKKNKNNQFKGFQVWLQMAPNDSKWLEKARDGSKSVKPLNKKDKRSHTVSKSFNFFLKCNNNKKLKSAKNC